MRPYILPAMNTVYQSSIRFHPQRNQLSITREGSAMSYGLETSGRTKVTVKVADNVQDPLLRGFNDRTTEMSSLQQELQGIVSPVAEKARSASRLGNLLGGVGLLAAGACAVAGLGTVAAVGVAALGIGAFVVGQNQAKKILEPVRNCIDLGWTLNRMQLGVSAAQPGLFQSTSEGQHASNPNFLQT